MYLRVIAATDRGASTAFIPEFESMRFARPLGASEGVQFCVLQLVGPKTSGVADSLPISGGLLTAALEELDWESATEAALEWGLEHALRMQLERVESHYRCACGAHWRDVWWRTDEDSCPACGVPCRPRTWRPLRCVFRSTFVLDEDRLDVLDIASA